MSGGLDEYLDHTPGAGRRCAREIGDSSDLTLLVEMLDNDRYAVYKILIAEVIIGIARRKEWSHCALSKALQQLRESEHSQRILEFAP
jgi:hypothetical protein